MGGLANTMAIKLSTINYDEYESPCKTHTYKHNLNRDKLPRENRWAAIADQRPGARPGQPAGVNPGEARA